MFMMDAGKSRQLNVIETSVLPSCGAAAFVGGMLKALDIVLIPSLLLRFIAKVDTGAMLDAGDINAACNTGKADQAAVVDIMYVLHQLLIAGMDVTKNPSHMQYSGQSRLILGPLLAGYLSVGQC